MNHIGTKNIETERLILRKWRIDKVDYLVLLRGINVGGKNIIKMDELKKIFEEMKFTDVKTYIQSGNVIFLDYENDQIKIQKKIERALFKKLNYKINIRILTFSEINEIVNNKPEGFGEDIKIYPLRIVFFHF